MRAWFLPSFLKKRFPKRIDARVPSSSRASIYLSFHLFLLHHLPVSSSFTCHSFLLPPAASTEVPPFVNAHAPSEVIAATVQFHRDSYTHAQHGRLVRQRQALIRVAPEFTSPQETRQRPASDLAETHNIPRKRTQRKTTCDPRSRPPRKDPQSSFSTTRNAPPHLSCCPEEVCGSVRKRRVQARPEACVCPLQENSGRLRGPRRGAVSAQEQATEQEEESQSRRRDHWNDQLVASFMTRSLLFSIPRCHHEHEQKPATTSELSIEPPTI